MEEIQYEITKTKNKLKELTSLHDKHLNRPTMDDNFDEEKSIDILTQEITHVIRIFVKFKTKLITYMFQINKILGQSQMKLRKMSIKNNSTGVSSSTTDKRLIKNVVNNLASSLQNLTTEFRKNQNLYLKSIIIL